MNYLLVWEIRDYDSNPTLSKFKTLREMDDFVNNKQFHNPKDFVIHFAGKIFEEYQYKPIEVVTKLERQ